MPRKWGQHLLVDEQYIEAITAQIDPQPGDLIVEIGPGKGHLTFPLLRRDAQVVAIEIDPLMIAALESNLGQLGQLTVLHRDVLKIDWLELLAQLRSEAAFERVKIVGNLPYYITTPILIDVLTALVAGLQVDKLVFMMQKEVGRRLCAEAGSRDFGAISVFTRVRACPQIKLGIPPSAFRPPPKVDSVLLELTPYAPSPYEIADLGFFTTVVRASFGQRRKVLAKSLAADRVLTMGRKELEAVIVDLGIDPQRRGETLSIAEFIDLSARIKAEQSRNDK